MTCSKYSRHLLMMESKWQFNRTVFFFFIHRIIPECNMFFNSIDILNGGQMLVRIITSIVELGKRSDYDLLMRVRMSRFFNTDEYVYYVSQQLNRNASTVISYYLSNVRKNQCLAILGLSILHHRMEMMEQQPKDYSKIVEALKSVIDNDNEILCVK